MVTYIKCVRFYETDITIKSNKFVSGKLVSAEKNKWFLCYFSYVNEAISNCINLSNYLGICNAGVLQNSEVSGINLVRAPDRAAE